MQISKENSHRKGQQIKDSGRNEYSCINNNYTQKPYEVKLFFQHTF